MLPFLEREREREREFVREGFKRRGGNDEKSGRGLYRVGRVRGGGRGRGG